jgi:GR25 family glycosyltransferase involved in LPS biosynthesis
LAARVRNGLQLDSVGALGATLSHVRCWRWLAAHPDVPYALVLEDDCRLHPDFAALWQKDVAPLLPSVDLIVLGYAACPHLAVPVRDTRTAHFRSIGFQGMHCYAVTQAGARRLLALRTPPATERGQGG